jgi:hypothetical protein
MPVDPKQYYAVLGVAASASATEIKRAFRRRAIELHPDTNKSPHAAEMFLLLKEAYETLSNVSRRAVYDTSDLAVAWEDTDADSQESETEPIVCSECSKITAQPRYVIFLKIKSYVVGTARTASQGIFCSECAAKAAIRATLTTWMLGWWALPFGPLYAAHAVFRNTLGGIKPKAINARIAARQAWYFASVGQPELARAIAADALRLTSDDPSDSAVKASVLRLLDVNVRGKPPRHLRNSWRLLRQPFFVQAAPLLVIVAVGANAVWLRGTPSAARPVPVAPPAPVAAVAPTTPPAPEKQAPQLAVRYRRPSQADNGVPWPTTSGYVPGYPRRSMGGLSTLTVDNSQNDSDVFAKLFTIGPHSRVLARAFFVPAGGQFTIESLERGRYDLRYRNLSSGALVKSDPFEFAEISGDDSVKVTTMKMTLYKVAGGTLRTQSISDEEFE